MNIYIIFSFCHIFKNNYSIDPLIGGNNNNPTCREFTYTFRRLLCRTGILPGENGNVVAVDGTNLIGIDTAATSALVQGNEPVVSPSENNWIVANLEPSEKYPLLLENIVVYTSGFVVRESSNKDWL